MLEKGDPVRCAVHLQNTVMFCKFKGHFLEIAGSCSIPWLHAEHNYIPVLNEPVFHKVVIDQSVIARALFSTLGFVSCRAACASADGFLFFKINSQLNPAFSARL